MKERHRRRHDLVSNKEDINTILPRTRSERNQVFGIMGLVFGAILALVGLFYVKQRTQLAREQNWVIAVGRIEDSRTTPVSRVDSMYGGRMLYEVQVLAVFSVNGSQQKRWITAEQPPKSLASARFEEAHWKGTQCIVRWNPSNPREIAIELRQFPELR